MKRIVYEPDRRGYPNRGVADDEYLPWLRHLVRISETEGVLSDRTNVGTYGIFGARMVFDLSKGFPLLTTKKIHLRSIIHELLWFLRGDTNIRYLNKNGVHIWDEWADDNGDLGPVYGSQWRSWPNPNGENIDQIKNVIEGLIKNPRSRRHLVTAWNPVEIPSMALPPCHCLFQFYVDEDSNLSCQLYQRSCDIFLGVPFNIASYSLLTMMVAQVCNYKPGALVHCFGDFHLYSNHIKQAEEQLTRTPLELPVMDINPNVKNIFEFNFEDFELRGYNPHPAIKAPIAV